MTIDEPTDIDRTPRWPERWLRPEISPVVVRFIDTRYDPELTTAEIRELFGNVRDISARPLPLRSIFLTMARSSRTLSKGVAA